jgi:hypothetical protein
MKSFLKPPLLIKLSFLFLSTIFYSQKSDAQMNPIGIFGHSQDIGDPKLKGSTTYDKEEQAYTMTGAGINMWATADQFQFAFKKIKGDFIVRATIKFVGEGTDAHRKIGIIAREELTADSLCPW